MGERIDVLRMASRETADYHRKSAEHQRVLLSSLNRQLTNLDKLLKSTRPSQDQQQRETSIEGTASTPRAKARSVSLNYGISTDTGSNRAKKDAAVPLTKVLARVLEPGRATGGESASSAGVVANTVGVVDSAAQRTRLAVASDRSARTRNPESRVFEDFDERRISNG